MTVMHARNVATGPEQPTGAGQIHAGRAHEQFDRRRPVVAAARFPGFYPQKLDFVRSCILQIAFGDDAYRAASFLDDRVLTPATRGAWIPIGRVAAQARLRRNTRPFHYILHTGHVGSTLLSRLLDDTGRVLSLREPLPMRTLAEAARTRRARIAALAAGASNALLEARSSASGARGYDATRAVVVKATSSAAALAPAILARRATTRAVYLNLRAEPHSQRSSPDRTPASTCAATVPQRMRRLRARLACTRSSRCMRCRRASWLP